MTTTDQRYNVGGVMLPQPFKIRRLGHFGFNAAGMAESIRFYRDLLGFKATDVLDFKQVPGMGEKLTHVAAEGRGFLSSAWWISTMPGIALALTVLAFNLLGDWIRDAMDPRLRQLG